jgi:cell division protease FtsH
VESNDFPPFEQTLSTKGFLAPQGSQTQRQAYETAIHEGGHAIVNDYANVGLKILTITVDASGGHLGYVNYEENPHLNWNRERVIARLASIFAGGLAQQMAGIGLDAGWSSDLQTARSLATQAIVHWGLGKELDSIFYPQEKEGKPQINQQVLEREVNAIMQEAYDLSKKTLAKNWKTLLLVAKKLMKHYTLNNEEWESTKKERIRGKTDYQSVTKEGIDMMKPAGPKNKNKCISSLQKK